MVYHARPYAPGPGGITMACPSLSLADHTFNTKMFYKLLYQPDGIVQLLCLDLAQGSYQLLGLQAANGSALRCPCGAGLFWHDGGLYLARLGGPGMARRLGPDGAADLLLLGPDGRVRRRFVLAPDQTFVPGTGIAQRDGSLYFTVHCYELGDELSTEPALYAQLLDLDTRTGSLQALRNLRVSAVHSLIGGWDSTVAIHRLARDGHQQMLLYAPLLDKLALSSVSHLLQGSYLLHVNLLYYWKPETESLYRFTPRSGRKTCLGQQLLGGATTRGKTRVQLPGLVDDHLLLQAVLPGQRLTLWAFDLQRYEMQPLTLCSEAGVPLMPLAQTRDRLLVRPDTPVPPGPSRGRPKKRPDLMPPQPSELPRYALIDKADFWAGRPHWQPCTPAEPAAQG